MSGLVCGAWLSAAWAMDVPSGAILRAADRVEVDGAHLAVSPDGKQVLVFGKRRATLLGPDGAAKASVPLSGIVYGAVANTGLFVMVHEGGVTVHSAEGAREQLRLAAMGRVNGVAVSPDGKRVALATSVALTVNDAIDGRVAFSSDGEATAVGYDPSSRLWITRDGVGIGFDPNGRSAGPGAMPVPPGVLVDGCVRPDQASPEALCLGDGGEGLLRDDGSVWVLDDGDLLRWRLLGDEIHRISGAGDVAIVDLAWASPTDVLVGRADGHIERRSADGAVVSDVLVPGCAPCVPVGFGGSGDGGTWAMGPGGAWQVWDAAGAPTLKRAKETGQRDAVRLEDGRWVTLGADGRARIGAAPGKGASTAPVAGALGVHAAGGVIAVWSATELGLFDDAGHKLGAPSLGVGRQAKVVAVAPDGSRVALIDDSGALHAYQPDGKPLFRVAVALVGDVLAWDAGGTTLLAGGDPLRLFSATDGAERATLVFSPGGAVNVARVAPDGTVAIAQGEGEAQVLRSVAPSVFAP